MSSVRTLWTSISNQAFQACPARLCLILAAALVLAGVVALPPAAAQTCNAVTRSNTQQSTQDGRCPCPGAEFTRLQNVAVLAINQNPPACAADCSPDGNATDAAAPSCTNLSATSSVCTLRLTRTQPCAVSSGVDDPLFLTLVMVLLVSLTLLYRFRRREDA